MKIIWSILVVTAAVSTAGAAYARPFRRVIVRFDEPVTRHVSAKYVAPLKSVALALENRDWARCANLARQSFWHYRNLQPWILSTQLRCQFQYYQAHHGQNERAFIQSLRYGWRRTSWLLNGPQAIELRVHLIDGTLAILDDRASNATAHTRHHRRLAHERNTWDLINSILDARNWLNVAERVRLYRDVSNISAAEHHTNISKQYLALANRLAPKPISKSKSTAKSPVQNQSSVAESTTANAPSPMQTLFHQAVSAFRKKDYSTAAADFDQYLDSHETDYDVSAMYWSWRAYQKLKSPKAKSAMARLIAHFPLSYYGLRARGEQLHGRTLLFPKKFARPVHYTLILRKSSFQAWIRYLLLVKAGWYKAAQAELATIVPPITLDGDLVFAKLWSAAHGYQRAAKYLVPVFEQNPKTITIGTIKIIYPDEYKKIISKASRRFTVSRVVVQAVIKQESSFKADAISPRGAIGLMQLMPVTARQLANDMRTPLKNPADDLTEPKTNILLGVDYLHRELRDFNGNLPLALAAYNAGIGNIRNWLHSRPDANSIMSAPTSDPASELWFDELPWQETSQYVKRILRNILLYRMLDDHSRKLDLSKNSVVFNGRF